MPELLKLKTTDWELSIWCRDIKGRQRTYFNTLNQRENSNVNWDLHLSPQVSIEHLEILSQPVPTDNSQSRSPRLQCGEPLFFENLNYQFEWTFFAESASASVDNAEVCHRLQIVNDNFRFVVSSNSRLVGALDTGNNVGWFSLPFRYQCQGQWKTATLSFEVLPTKMDLHSDLPAMYRSIDAIYPLWRFSLAEKTQQNVAKNQQRRDFPLLWLAHFQKLREQFMQGLKVIENVPHSRLQSSKYYSHADRLKGKTAPRLQEKVREDLKSGYHSQRYPQEKKYLSVDTPENRFIKNVVHVCQRRLESLYQKLESFNQQSEHQRLSDSFLQEIKQWQLPLRKMHNQSFLKEVGKFTDLAKASLVLQQKTGYSAVYRVWQDLKFYLAAFDQHASISMKSIADIYEVWCFLRLRTLLIEQLGFSDVLQNSAMKLKLQRDQAYQLQDGMAGAFEFEREDGIKARLAHEPLFKKSTVEICSFSVAQKPDILLELIFPDGHRCIWLFDAKYRIKTIKQKDHVPEDAINQMHRYRDALIYREKQDGMSYDDAVKSRPVLGAFALYPGFFDQAEDKNPYDSAINEVGIGAFALLPSANDSEGAIWLTRYLQEQIGRADDEPVNTYPVSKRKQENLYIKEPARIVYHGMKQALYPDLVLTARTGDKRSENYLDAFRQGSAGFYHIPELTMELKFSRHIVHELAYLAIAVESESSSQLWRLEYIWRIKSLRLLPRSDITEKVTGSNYYDQNQYTKYWVFELSKPVRLMQVLELQSNRFRDSLKLTTFAALSEAETFDSIARVYDDAISSEAELSER